MVVEMIVVIEMIIMMVQIAAMTVATARHAHSGASRNAHSGMTGVTATVRGSCD
jgi:hypothetical protein